MQKNALGRGLGALISGAAKRGGPGMAEAVPGTEGAAGALMATGSEAGEGVSVGSTGVNQVAITSIVPSPMQPRKTFRDEQLTELMESIREHGLIQPLVVRKVNGRLELIAGERRFRACQKLGLGEVPVIEREAGDREVLEMALIENLQREDLNPVEEAEAYTRLAKEFGLRQEDIAQRVGKNRATVANAMRLLDLAAPVRGLLAQGLITTGHAKALLGLRDAALQTMVADMVVRNGLTVRQTEQQVQKELAGTGSAPAAVKAGKPKGPDLGAHLHRIQSNLRQHFATQVTLQHTPKKGRIEIEYYGDDDLGRILELLGIEAE
jgi:ParB family chromosome partitioning protein